MIDLALVNHEKELAALRLKAERAEQAEASYQKMRQDAEQLNFRSFFDLAMEKCQANLHEVLTPVVETDYAQADKLQKELKAFENNYFKEYMSIAQN